MLLFLHFKRENNLSLNLKLSSSSFIVLDTKRQNNLVSKIQIKGRLWGWRFVNIYRDYNQLYYYLCVLHWVVPHDKDIGLEEVAIRLRINLLC